MLFIRGLSLFLLLLLFFQTHSLITTTYAYCVDVHGCYSCVSTNYQVDTMALQKPQQISVLFLDQLFRGSNDNHHLTTTTTPPPPPTTPPPPPPPPTSSSSSSSSLSSSPLTYQCGWCDKSHTCLLVENNHDSHRPCFQSDHNDSCHSGCSQDAGSCVNCSSIDSNSWMTVEQDCSDWQLSMQISNFGFFLVGSLSLLGSTLMIISIIVTSVKQWPRSFIANRFLIYLGISDILLSLFCMFSSIMNWIIDLGQWDSIPSWVFQAIWQFLWFTKNTSYSATNLWSVALALSLTLSCTRWGIRTQSTRRFWLIFEILSHIICWGISLFVGIPALFYSAIDRICFFGFCIVRIRYLILAMIPIICSLINIILYIFIMRTIHNSHSKVVRSGNVKRAAELMVFFRLSFLLLPAFIVNANQVMVYFLQVLDIPMPLWMNVVDSVCLPLQGLANAVLYCLTTERFRAFLSRILPSRDSRKYMSVTADHPDLAHTPLNGSYNAIDELEDDR